MTLTMFFHTVSSSLIWACVCVSWSSFGNYQNHKHEEMKTYIYNA